MACISFSILPIFFMILVVLINIEATSPNVGGGLSVWPIWNLEDPKVVSIAKFALANYNTETDKDLRLVTIIDGSYSGIRDGVERGYDISLIILAKDDSNAQPKKYTASIIYRPRKEHPVRVKYVEIFKRFLPGGMWLIDNLKAPEVVYAAKFAVEKHNKEANTTLNFVTVVKGKRHAVEGSLLHLVISAKDSTGAQPKEYEAAIWQRLWLKKDALMLESFKILSESIFN